MRKVKLVSILVILVFIISGCSGGNTDNSMPFKREHNAKDDVIKFYDLDWFSEVNKLLEKFDNDFGKDTYTVNKFNNTEYTSSYIFYIKGKDGKDLGWNIAGHEVKMISLDTLSNDGGEHCYLISGTYIFKNFTDETLITDLKEKLRKLYIQDENRDYLFTDKNENYVDVEYSGLKYYCKDGELLKQTK